jgi:hypothetical protein
MGAISIGCGPHQAAVGLHVVSRRGHRSGRSIEVAIDCRKRKPTSMATAAAIAQRALCL